MKFLLFTAFFIISIGACTNTSRPPDSPPRGSFLPAEECAELEKCSSETACPGEGKTEGCFRGLCENEQAVCINEATACQKVCNQDRCTVLESFPMQLQCQ